MTTSTRHRHSLKAVHWAVPLVWDLPFYSPSVAVESTLAEPDIDSNEVGVSQFKAERLDDIPVQQSAKDANGDVRGVLGSENARDLHADDAALSGLLAQTLSLSNSFYESCLGAICGPHKVDDRTAKVKLPTPESILTRSDKPLNQNQADMETIINILPARTLESGKKAVLVSKLQAGAADNERGVQLPAQPLRNDCWSPDVQSSTKTDGTDDLFRVQGAHGFCSTTTRICKLVGMLVCLFCGTFMPIAILVVVRGSSRHEYLPILPSPSAEILLPDEIAVLLPLQPPPVHPLQPLSYPLTPAMLPRIITPLRPPLHATIPPPFTPPPCTLLSPLLPPQLSLPQLPPVLVPLPLPMPPPCSRPWLPSAEFVDPTGGSSGVCAGDGKRSFRAADISQLSWLTSELDCAVRCLQSVYCVAFEFAAQFGGRCKLEREWVTHTLPAQGFVCRIKRSLTAPFPSPPTSTPS
mmetsp:Transcript_69006/g.114690  ORF Transcript_69006/g.114690 Transcript_69006/m.114690 type:complete len:466 (+) Transcript_69006:16-1413(+)